MGNFMNSEIDKQAWSKVWRRFYLTATSRTIDCSQMSVVTRSGNTFNDDNTFVRLVMP